MRLKVHQIVAIIKSVKSKAEGAITSAYHIIQKQDLFEGFVRTYRPLNEETGEKLPPESKVVQQKIKNVVDSFSAAIADLINQTVSLDRGNSLAKADIIIDGVVLARDIPSTSLIALEKQFTNLQTFVSKLPILDPSKEWSFDAAKELFATKVVENPRSIKKDTPVTLAAASEKFAAQVQLIKEDVCVGYFSRIDLSSAMLPGVKQQLLDNVQRLLKAIKLAREQANTVEVDIENTVGQTLLSYVFDPLK